MVVQADDIAGYGCFRLLTITREKGNRVRHFDILADASVTHLHASFILAGTDAHKRDAVAVIRVHICLNLKDESAEVFLLRVDDSGLSLSALGRRSPLDEIFEHFLDAEVSQCGAKEHRGQLSL